LTGPVENTRSQGKEAQICQCSAGERSGLGKDPKTSWMGFSTEFGTQQKRPDY